MAGALLRIDDVPGLNVPVHRALTEHILLGGAPRAIAIMNGTYNPDHLKMDYSFAK